MKRLLSILIIGILTFNSFSYATNVDNSSNTPVQSTLAKKIKNLVENDDLFTVLFDGKRINVIVKEAVEKISEKDKEEAIKDYPQISFDLSNFDTEYSTYSWLAEFTKILIKEAIEKEHLTQEMINQMNTSLQEIGMSPINITIHKGMSDTEIELVCEQIVDFIQILTNNETLRRVGIDLNDPEVIERLRKSFSDSMNK